MVTTIRFLSRATLQIIHSRMLGTMLVSRKSISFFLQTPTFLISLILRLMLSHASSSLREQTPRSLLLFTTMEASLGSMSSSLRAALSLRILSHSLVRSYSIRTQTATFGRMRQWMFHSGSQTTIGVRSTTLHTQ